MKRCNTPTVIVVVSTSVIGLFVLLLARQAPDGPQPFQINVQTTQQFPPHTQSVGTAHSSLQAGREEWSRIPKKIAFQNDSQWEDNRWQQTELGPFLTASIDTNKKLTLKGIAIRIGNQGEAAVCFDTARMRISAAWTGDFLRFGPRRFGLIRHPQSAGKVAFVTKKLAGWANGNRFKPKPSEITLPEVEIGYTATGRSVVHLPKEWAAYRGLYTSGNRVVLSYSVGITNVLESPWYVRTAEAEAFIRSLEIGPAIKTLRMSIADSEAQVTVIGNAAVKVTRMTDGTPMLVVAPHVKPLRVKLLISRKQVKGDAIGSLVAAAGGVEDLLQLIKTDTGRWPKIVQTTGTTTETGGPYVIDTLTLPFENPYKALFFTAGHDFFSDGSAAVCTVHGDVWVVTGIDRQLRNLRWKRFATGLFQPLGLKIVKDKVYVIGRDQLTRLHDRNGDGEADYYENFNNDLFVTSRNHDYVTCLDTDPQGNFYFIHAKTGVMRVSADGSTMTQIADGFRNPNGMGVSPNGLITAAPQQGTWTPESSLVVVKPGGYYGFGGPRITKNRPSGWDLPMCFIPRALDNSGGAQVWVEGNKWGPLGGKMLHLSYGQCRLLLALTEDVDGVLQGGTIKFPTAPVDFESGIMRGRFNPRDGQLYVTGLRGWQTRAIRDGCFQRLRYTGGALHLPTCVKTYRNGIKLTFSEPIDPEYAENPDNYFVEQWNYRWSKEYGSPDFSVNNPGKPGRDEVPVVSATLMDDGHAVFLEMPGRDRVMQISISWLLRSIGGKRFRGTFAHTINTKPVASIPNTQIVRRKRLPRIAADVQRRLKPGLRFRFEPRQGNAVDLRTSRLAALIQSAADSPTPFLSPGPFDLKVTGTLRTPLSGFYDFKLVSQGNAKLWINNKPIIITADHAETTEPILIHKGHNRLRIDYDSPNTGITRFQLWWKGHDFDWEPVPPSVFFHDSGEVELAVADRRRLGRQLFADNRCAACHRTDVGKQAMFELSLAGPDLSEAGDRFNASWLQRWLKSPETLRPGSHMPALLGHGDLADRDAADITAFLLGQRSTAGKKSPTDNKRVANEGRLYESLGCITCHHFEPPGQTDQFGRLSLYHTNAKYRPGALSEYLKKPTAHFAASPMPEFRLNATEVEALAAFVRSRSQGTFSGRTATGSMVRGQKLFTTRGCQQCHTLGKQNPLRRPHLAWKKTVPDRGCLAKSKSPKDGTPAFHFSEDQRLALKAFVQNDLSSLRRTSPVETSARISERLRCASCHDRDGWRSERSLIIADEGSGRTPEVLPALTWAGDKFRPEWTESFLAGRVKYKPRPWLAARMPAFPAFATPLARGFAAEHGIDPLEKSPHAFDDKLAKIGEKLTLKSGLDCRQCHAIGKLRPRGDKKTKISLGMNFTHIRDRLRRDSYQRFMLNPPRYDINSKMIRFSANGLSTKLKTYFDADAHQQFDALWHYIQSLPDPESDTRRKQSMSHGR